MSQIQLDITNKQNTCDTNTYHAPPTPVQAYLRSVKSNEADIKGAKRSARIAFRSFCEEMSDRNPQGGRKEGEERNAVGREQLVSIGMLRLALLLLREGFGVFFFFFFIK